MRDQERVGRVPGIQTVAGDGRSQPREFPGHKRVKHKRVYLKSFGGVELGNMQRGHFL